MTFAPFAEVTTPSDKDAINRRGKQVWTGSEHRSARCPGTHRRVNRV